MVTMNSDKAVAKRKPDPNNGATTTATSNGGEEATIAPYQPLSAADESPNNLLYKKMERIVEKMQVCNLELGGLCCSVDSDVPCTFLVCRMKRLGCLYGR